jgi:signal transduction histidine kinase
VTGESTPPSDSDSPARSSRGPADLWSEALQALAGLVAHDLRNALNVVAVNLEVARSRSARGADASAIAPFAATAATNFETAAAAAEALLAFARAEPAEVNLAAIVGRLGRLFGIGGRRTLHIADHSGGRARTSVPADIARATVARSVLAALSGDDTVACEITVHDGILLSVTGATRVSPLPDSELVAAAAAHGVRFASRDRALELRFPAVD